MIRPRFAWADGIADAPALATEEPGDVKVLLVHHTATYNDYGPDKVADLIQSFHRYHTTTKGWPDVAYNFFVDRYGDTWEGRTGSLAAPVIGDATGGNQGFSQLCCFIGDHTSEPPTPEAQDAMVSLLAMLARRYGVDASPDATATFASRGSNTWLEGATITTPTIEGHRFMSATTCPGDAAYALVASTFRPAVEQALAASLPAPTTTEVDPATTSTLPAATSSTTVPPTTVAATTALGPTTIPATTVRRSSSDDSAAEPGATGEGPTRDGADRWLLVGGAAAGTTAAVATGAVWWLRRSSARADGPDGAEGPPEGASPGQQ